MTPLAEPRAEHPTAAARWTPWADWICALALLALWLVSRPYRGVRHDAILYLGQVLTRLMPERYVTDIFLHSPAQDRYSAFSPLMAPIVAHFGVGGPELVLIACCHAFFLFAVWKLMEGWFDRPLRWAALMLVAVLPHTYGGLGEFSYAEPFLTARSIAEPLGLFALGQLLRGRIAPALLLAVLAMAFHPLITLPVLIVGWSVLIMRRRSWAWLGLLAVVPGVLAVAGIAPFDAISRSFDDAWMAVIREPNAQVFAASYGSLDWAALAFDVLMPVLLLMQARQLPVAPLQLARATLIAAALLTATWVIGADGLRNVLLTQLQLWRVDWLLHLLAMVALPVVLLRYWQRGWVGRWCAAALAAAGFAVMSNWDTGWICLLWALAALAVDRWRLEMGDRLAKVAALASGLIMLMVSAKVTWTTMLAISHSPDNFNDAGLVLVLLSLPLVDGLLVAGLIAALARRTGAARVLVALAAAVGVAFGLSMWDQRSPWQRRLEGSLEAGPPVFDEQVPPGAVVYWDKDLITPWLLGRRGNFFSRDQGAGLLFDRAAAMEYSRRHALIAAIDEERGACQLAHARTRTLSAPGSTCVVPLALVGGLCKMPGRPDYLVFPDPLPTAPAAEWHEAIAADATRRKSFYLYSCAQLSGSTAQSLSQKP